MGDTYYKRKEIIGDCTLYLGDCLDVMPTLDKVDAVVTDPPYGVDLGSHSGSKEKRSGLLCKQGYSQYSDTFENFTKKIVPALKMAIDLSDRAMVFCSEKGAWQLPTPDALGGIYMPAACGRNSWGFQCISHLLLYGSAPDLNLGAKATSIRSTAISEKNGHPCPKPIEWMKWCVSLGSRKDETILDPFMGSGTTGVACVKLGRKFIGIELDEKYFDIACKRIEEAYRQPDMFIEPVKHIQDKFI